MNKKNICGTCFYDASTYTRERERKRKNTVHSQRVEILKVKNKLSSGKKRKKNSQTNQTDY